MVSFFGKLKAGLEKTRAVLNTPVQDLFKSGRRVDEALLEELEFALIAADVGPTLAGEATAAVRKQYKDRVVKEPKVLIDFLVERLSEGMRAVETVGLARAEAGPTVVLMVGVNGTGKTTTTAKLARLLKEEGASVLLAAADTFRAAAGEQLDIWAGRVGVEIVRHQDGADPAAVVFDACDAALARSVDYVLVDTAGRLHNKDNLMRQLEKIHRVAEKKIPGAPHEVLLVLDGTTGQNALAQARVFAQGVGVTGLVLTKLDGTAKGGVALAINHEIQLPIKYLGTGEKETDIAPFDPHAFCEALFAGAAD